MLGRNEEHSTESTHGPGLTGLITLLKDEKIILGTSGGKCLSDAVWGYRQSPVLVHSKKKISKTLLDLSKISEELKKRNLIPSEFIKFS